MKKESCLNGGLFIAYDTNERKEIRVFEYQVRVASYHRINDIENVTIDYINRNCTE